MTLTSSTTRLSYNGDGATASFSVTFKFWDADDLRVILRDADGNESVWTRGTEYTVTGGDGSTGTVEVETTPTDYTPASGEKLVILSDVPDTQETSFPLGGPFLSTAAEQEFDKTVRRIQQQGEALDRALKFSETSPDTGVNVPDLTGNADKVWIVKSDESGLEAKGLVDLDALALPIGITNIGDIRRTRADLTSISIPSVVTELRTSGYATVGDGGGATYKRVGSEPGHSLKVQSLDGAWWEIAEPQTITFQACGGVEGDDSGNGAENVTAFNAFIGYLQDRAASGVVRGPSLVFPVMADGGDYHFNAHLNVKAVVHITGSAGWFRALEEGGPLLHFPADTHGIIVHRSDTIDETTEAGSYGADGSVIENIALIGGGNDQSSGHGIWLRARATLRHVYVRDFAGNGFYIAAAQGGGGATEGNTNLFKLENCAAEFNRLSGFYIDFADANAGHISGCNGSFNGRAGFWDSSFLGNTYFACHSSGNGVATRAGNGAGESSIVHFNVGGTDKRFIAAIGASEADLVATEPGTDGSVWIEVEDGGSTSFFPTWQSSQPEGTYFHGGPYITDNANAHNLLLNCYSESDWPQYVLPTMVFGGHKQNDAQGEFLSIRGAANSAQIITSTFLMIDALMRIRGDSAVLEFEDESTGLIADIDYDGATLRLSPDNAGAKVLFEGRTGGDIDTIRVRKSGFKDVAISSGTTGGTGSAGAGSQYVEVEIDGTVYKVLHDGVV